MIKQLVYICSSFLLSQAVSALNIDDGLYAGVILGASWAPAINIQSPVSFQLNYDVMGQVGAQLGYRWDKIRAEAEFFYNSNTYSNVVLNGVTYSSNKSTENFYTGQTNIMFGMFNLYYDLLPPPGTDANFGPFIGIGAGYGSIQNTLAITYNSVQITPGDLARSHSNYGGQVIGGVFAFLDDFSYFMLDLRYFATPNYTQNITLQNGVTQQISYNNQVISINLAFNGSIDLG
jgi:hypothetical protein